MSAPLTGAIALLLAPGAAASAYLATLAGLALLPKRKPATQAHGPATRFAVVVPAHNEEALLPRLLESLSAQDYPADRFSVHVIADNCSDATAETGRSHGAAVHERREPDRPGKGQAIAWLLPLLAGPETEAYAFVDADSTIDANFLAAMSSRLGRGERALQASYRVADPESAPLVTLRAIAFALMHELRGRGKARLGVSCGIWGNGIVLAREVVERTSWQSFSSVEDAEQHIRLVLDGVKVTFVPETSVYGFMPSSLGSAAGQQQRWEAGRLALLRRYWRPLLGAAVSRRNGSAAVLLLELAIPPLSVLLIGELGVTALAWLFGSPAAKLLSAAAIGGLAAYISVGLTLSGLRPRAYLALAHAPRYVFWKAWLYVRELRRRAEPAWTRTTRDGAA